MEDQQPRITTTHSAEEHGGTAVGVPAAQFKWVALALIAGVAVVLALTPRLGLLRAAPFGLVPVALVVLALGIFRGHSAGRLLDWIDQLFTRGNARPLDHGTPPPGRASLLPDAYVVGDRLVFGNPAAGALSAGWFLELPDLRTASYAEQNRLQEILATLQQQMPEHLHLAVQWSEDPDPLERLLLYHDRSGAATTPAARFLRNANWLGLTALMERGELRRKRLALFVGRKPSAAPFPKGRKGAVQNHAASLEQAEAEFKAWEQTLNHTLEPADGRAIRMTDADLIRRWAATLTPSSAGRPGYDPVRDFDPHQTLLDNCWHSDLSARGRDGFFLDGWYHGVLTLKRLPRATNPLTGHRLTSHPFGEYTVTWHVRRIPREAAIARAQREQDRLNTQLAQKPDERLTVSRDQIAEKIRRLASGDIVPTEIECVIVVRAKTPDQLRERMASLKTTIQDLDGAQYYEASLPATARNLFARTLPGWLWSPHRCFPLYGESRYVADLLLMAGSWGGHPGPVQALFPGTHGNLVNLVLFLGEGADEQPQHFIVVGCNGAGKSVVVCKILIETEAFYAYTVIIEEGLSHASFTRALGAEPIIVRLDASVTINLFDTRKLPLGSFQRSSLIASLNLMVRIPADEDRAARESALIARHVDQLYSDHAQDQLLHWSRERRDALVRHALVLHRWSQKQSLSQLDAFLEFQELQRRQPDKAQEELALCEATDLREFESRHPELILNLAYAYFSPDEQPTLSALREHLELAGEDEELCRLLALRLAPWCRGGNYGAILDGPSNVAPHPRVAHYELGFIPDSARELKAVLAAVILNRERQHILALPRTQRKRVVIEEVSRFLDLPRADVFLRECYEQLLKFNCQILAILQQYSRIADTPIRVALVGNTRAWLIFNTGSQEDVERLGDAIGLSRLARETILRLPRPDQQTGPKYSEFLYYHTDPRRPICGPVRYYRLPEPDPSLLQTPSQS
ncbi:MAG: TraC family protein [Verrucomicrobiales bacterium]|nr:TraC family protein [Verrucomicrobiales bacterium]